MPPMPGAARDALCARVLDAVRLTFGGYLRGAILKGSALKDDFVPGYSDFDVHCFVDGAAMESPELPRPEFAFGFQAAIGGLEPREWGVNAVQVYFLDADRYPADWVKPLPPTYRLVYGELPPGFTEIDPADYVANAGAYFPTLRGWRTTLLGRFFDKPDGALAPIVRLAGTILKPVPFCALTLVTGDPFAAWPRPLHDVLPRVAPLVSPSGSLAAFFAEVPDWINVERDPGRLRAMMHHAIVAIDEATAWGAAHAAR